MRLLPSPPLLVALLLVGCGPSNPSPAPSPRNEEIRVPGTAQPLTVQHDVDVSEGDVPAPFVRVWSALLATYDDLGIPVGAVDASRGSMGSSRFRVRRIGEQRPSHWFNCGSNIAGNVADHYEVYAVISSTVAPLADSLTRVVTTVDAAARPSGVSGNDVHCASTGRLESEILKRVDVRSGAAVPGG